MLSKRIVGPKLAFRIRSRVQIIVVRLAICIRIPKSVVGCAPAVVSLTSYGSRIRDVHFTVASIAMGSVRPTRVILWLAKSDYHLVTPELLSLQKRGLEIRTTTDFGPHKKYYPYCAETTAHRLPLVTADDDVIYPRRWLSELIECAAQEKEPTIVAHRSHRIKIRAGSLMPYLSWGIGEGTITPCYANMATGICGVLYPPAFTSKVATVWQTDFMEVAPRADDIWLHSRALLLGIPTKQVKDQAANFVEHHPSTSVGLSVDNVAGGGNDSVIDKLYNSDLALKISTNVRSGQ